MNGPDPYDRQLDRLPDDTRPSPDSAATAEPPALAVRHDPSQQPVAPNRQGAGNGSRGCAPANSRCAWDHPSPAAASTFKRLSPLGRGAFRTPLPAGNRTTRSAIARPAVSPTNEGVEL